MFPEHVADVLQQLSYISTILIGVCMLFGVKKLIEVYQDLRAVSSRLDAHIQMDDMRFSRVNQDLGRHDSQINDLKQDVSSGLAATIKTLISNHA